MYIRKLRNHEEVPARDPLSRVCSLVPHLARCLTAGLTTREAPRLHLLPLPVREAWEEPAHARVVERLQRAVLQHDNFEVELLGEGGLVAVTIARRPLDEGKHRVFEAVDVDERQREVLGGGGRRG